MSGAPSIGDLNKARINWKSRIVNSSGIRLGIAATFTAEPIVPFLGHHLSEMNIECQDILLAPYNQIIQATLDPSSSFGEKVDAAILLWRLEDMFPAALLELVNGNDYQLDNIVESAAVVADAAIELQRKNGIPTILALPPVPFSPSLDSGSFAFRAPLAACHREVVKCVEGRISGANLLLFDLSSALTFYGVEEALDWRKWYLYRQPYTEKFWWYIAQIITKLLSLSRGACKKCLVLDCDNTIWGGVIGEDGIEGIELGEDFPGSAYRDFQRQAVMLAARGVFLALASKNNPEDVWRVFDEHDGMEITRDQISVEQIGWHSKVDSILDIAQKLNIGLDAVVFVDDSPFEIESVRSQLPEVTCLQVPEDPVDLPLLLVRNRLFDQVKITDEDRARVTSFKAEFERDKLKLAIAPDEFQRSLELQVKIGAIKPAQVSRVAQLINKTNQFNLTTHRRTEAEVLTLIANDIYSVLTLELDDRFGSYGLVGVAILKDVDDIWELDTFLLSCRALGRGVEDAFMATIAQLAKGRGYSHLRGFFFPTPKNKVAEPFLTGVGFKKVTDDVFEATPDEISPVDPSVQLSINL